MGDRSFRIVAVPFNSAGLASGVARGPRAILEAGAIEQVSAVGRVDLLEVPVEGIVPVRGPSGFLSEGALAASLADAAKAVGGGPPGGARSGGHFLSLTTTTVWQGSGGGPPLQIHRIGGQPRLARLWGLPPDASS